MNDLDRKAICAMFCVTNLLILTCFGLGLYSYIELKEIKQELQILEGSVIHD